MLYNPKKFFTNSKILSLLFLSSCLLPIPFFNINEGKAALEFQWDGNPNFKKLQWFQRDNKRRARNKIFFFIKSFTRNADLLKITVKIPDHFTSTLKKEKISLCQVKIGGFETNTKCIKNIQADIELNEDNTSLDIFPYSPIPSDKKDYAVVFKVFNPRKSGLFQFHSYGQYAGKDLVSRYLGSWTIVID